MLVPVDVMSCARGASTQPRELQVTGNSMKCSAGSEGKGMIKAGVFDRMCSSPLSDGEDGCQDWTSVKVNPRSLYLS